MTTPNPDALRQDVQRRTLMAVLSMRDRALHDMGMTEDEFLAKRHLSERARQAWLAALPYEDKENAYLLMNDWMWVESEEELGSL